MTGSWVNVASNTSWAVTAPAWVLVGQASGSGDKQVSLAVQANKTAAARTGTVTFTTTAGSPRVTRTFTVTQAVLTPTILVNSKAWSVGPWVESLAVMVKSDAAWVVTGPAWVSISPTSGDTNGVVTLTTQANGPAPRSGTVTFTTTEGSPRITRTIPVTQTGASTPWLTVGSENWNLSSVAWSNPHYVEVVSNQAWSVTVSGTGGSWVSIDTATGSGNGRVGVLVQANPAAQARSATLTFTTTTGSPPVVRTITINQAGTADSAVPGGIYQVWSDLSQPLSGRIEYPRQIDWIRFVPTETGYWTITSVRPAGDSLLDPYGLLYAADAKDIIYQDDDRGGDWQFKLQARLEAGQTYWLQVNGSNWGNDTGAYTVTARPGLG